MNSSQPPSGALTNPRRWGSPRARSCNPDGSDAETSRYDVSKVGASGNDGGCAAPRAALMSSISPEITGHLERSDLLEGDVPDQQRVQRADVGVVPRPLRVEVAQQRQHRQPL